MNYLFDYLPSLLLLTETCSLVMAFSLSVLFYLDLEIIILIIIAPFNWLIQNLHLIKLINSPVPHQNYARFLIDSYSCLFLITRFRLFKDSDPRHGKAPFFGAQMAPDCEGTIKIGDPVFLSR